MALQGTLDTFALPDVLRLLAATQKTGRLRLTGPRGTGTVSVLEGGIGTIDAPAAPYATNAVDALFELLRFEQGSFTFDADVLADVDATATADVEDLLREAESLLSEWREIESVVPSLDAWVTLRQTIEGPHVSVSAEQWPTVVAVGSGATVRQMADELSMGELSISRSVRDLLELGLIDLAPDAPPGLASGLGPRRVDAPAPATAPKVNGVSVAEQPGEVTAPDATPSGDDALPTARPLRARRPRAPRQVDTSTEAEVFVPLDLPAHGAARSYDDQTRPDVRSTDVEDLSAVFPGLAARAGESAAVDCDDDELAQQLATLSPRAAAAVRAAAEATTMEARAAALDEAEASSDAPIDRGLLLKFLSSVKS